jgi:hypothetical protein
MCRLGQYYDAKNDKNKNIFFRTNENNGLSYLTSDVKGYLNKGKENNDEIYNNYSNINDLKKKDFKSFLIKMIDNTIDSYKKQYKCGLYELIKRFYLIKSLLNFKKRLMNNNETNIINGRQLNNPNENIIKEYTIIHNKMSNFSEQRKRKDEHKRLIKCYSQMTIQAYKNNLKNNNTNIYDKELSKKQSCNKSVNISKNLSSIIKFDSEISLADKKQLINLNKKHKSNIAEIFDKNEKKEIEIIMKNKVNDNNSQRNHFYDEQETKESNRTKNNNYNLFNSVNESSKNDILSVLSVLNEKEKKNFLNFNKKIKYLKSLKINSEKEKKFLEGFQKDEPKKPKIFNMGEDEGPKFRDFSEIYKKEQETLEKLNPILFNLKKKKEDEDIKKLMKKKEFKKLTEKLIMKGRRFKIKKSPDD